jgi:hypothetical protein
MTKDKGTMLVLGGHGVFGSMIGAAAEAAGWTAIRTSRQPAAGFRHVDLAEPDTLEKVIDEADVIVSTVPDRQVVAERMVLDRGGLLVNVSAMAASSVAGLLREREWLTAAKRHRTTVVRLPEPYGRRRCLGIAEQHGGWLGPVASGKTVSTYMCVTERGLHGALLAVNATGLIGRVAGSAAASAAVPEATAEPVRHWVAVRRSGTLLAAKTLRCQGDYRSAAAATVLMAGQLTSRRDPLPVGVLVPEEVLTIDELEPGLDEAGITVADEPAGDARARVPSAG